ncbi:TIGR03086 family metal-binding protein [Streptomyces sp. NBC_01216]|uniref:TIGR03086 family metal-binding protein n=1 Tax=unclassified Streptomyces TaxID=2593676 RepID=UPI002E0E8F3E|nr:TIGR03086 family metal-binding protein [Streptomyces sp. NBC_01216]
MNDIHTHLTICADEAARVARGVTREHLAGPSVCADWTVGELADHLVLYTSHGLEHRARREPLPETLLTRAFTADADWAERYTAQLGRALAAWRRPDAWEGRIDLGFMTLPAAVMASLLVKELAVHGWDLARSTGQDFALPDATAEFLLGVVTEHAEEYRRHDGFAAPVEVAADAPALSRALAASGRDPRR